ncbi:MAG: DNA starvation/stationary phase protection protein [Solirubrobacteraceae bacterium]|jgi:starvation-inducible DNA-binding protein
MSTSTRARTTAYLPPLGTHERAEAGQQLQETLVELVDLALTGKQLHWSVTGPFFRSLHLQLDELIGSWRELGDTVAERAVAIGFMPDGRAGTVARDSALGAVEPGSLEDHFVVSLLTRSLAEAVERVRVRMDRLSEIDPASEDVLVEVVRALEEQLWMIRVQLSS